MSNKLKEKIAKDRIERANAISEVESFNLAVDLNKIPSVISTTLSEALILGLIRQGVKKYISVFGHGSTEIGEVLRIYEQAGVIKTYQVRNEISGTHAAMALRWVCGEKAAVITSIGPGALQAFAASLTAASNGIGLWFIFGDETSEDEGPNMQQIPGNEQHSFLKTFSALSESYCLHTPHSLPTALRKGLNTVEHPYRGQPFYLLLPMNTQVSFMESFNIRELPYSSPPFLGPAEDSLRISEAASVLLESNRVVVKLGGGSRQLGNEISEFLELVDGIAVLSPSALGCIPFNHPRNMTIGGSKGSLSGNYAMEEADCLVSIGSRSVCQSDCSRTGYPNVRSVISINTDMNDVTHYHDNIALFGDGKLTLKQLNRELKKQRDKSHNTDNSSSSSSWLESCMKKRTEWDIFRKNRYSNPTLYDDRWKRLVLTQPAAINTVLTWAKNYDIISFFDAGDVQANGFQIDESDSPHLTYTETGSSYMGWAVSSLLITGIAKKPFYGVALSGDGSFTMNPQILIDGVQHNARGCIVILDNRRMGAISGLQNAQYGADYGTWDSVNVDYVKWAGSISGVMGIHGGYTLDSLTYALDKAYSYNGLSLISVPVYYGPNKFGGMGVFGRWNVGNWTDDTQNLRHSLGL